jgi:hypothetical protein
MTTTDLSSEDDRRDAELLTRILQVALSDDPQEKAGLGALIRDLRETEGAAIERIAASLQLRRVGARISTAH